jgi:hypothetical protein
MKKSEPAYNEDEVARCRNVRDFLDHKFKTVDAYCAWLEQRDRKHKASEKSVSITVTRKQKTRAGANSKARARSSAIK